MATDGTFIKIERDFVEPGAICFFLVFKALVYLIACHLLLGLILNAVPSEHVFWEAVWTLVKQNKS